MIVVDLPLDVHVRAVEVVADEVGDGDIAVCAGGVESDQAREEVFIGKGRRLASHGDMVMDGRLLYGSCNCG